MRATLLDHTGMGRETGRIVIDDLPDRITLRDLIALRVREEVARFNKDKGRALFNGLVQPDDSEVVLNGYALRTPRRLDWEKQAEKAFDAFARNGFFVLVGQRQVEDLAETIDLTTANEVSFIKLVPIVGG